MALDMEMTAMMLYDAITEFTPDLTSQEKQVCAWVAEQASGGARRIYYAQAMEMLGATDDRQITRVLKRLRERLDDVHKMIQFPIVNTTSPYFDIHPNADYIWDGYCRAEREHSSRDSEAGRSGIQGINSLQRDRVLCCV